MPVNPLILRLEHGAELRDDDRERLRAVTARSRQVAAHEDLIREGERPDDVRILMDGFACRYKLLPDGRRQIIAFLVPGDFCDLHVAILGEMDHSIATLTACTIVDVPVATIDELTTAHPRINRALLWATLTEAGTLREWLVSMGQRAADRQLAHLLCELLVRLRTVDRADANGCELPLTQEQLGDALGLSAVHVNRMLQQLREDGLIVLRDRHLAIADVARLEAFAGFTANYLHLTPRTRDARDAPQETVRRTTPR